MTPGPPGPLDAAEVGDALASGRLGWRLEGGELVKDVDCGDFRGALDYVNRVGALAEAAGHHPDVDIRWRTVVLHLTTHSAGGITAKDLALAREIDGLGAS